MADPEIPGRAGAIRLIERDRARTLELLARLPPDALTVPGLGGGDWAPKDLVGHLESWEELALDALEAWERGGRTQLDDLQSTLDTDGINARNLERKAGASWEAIRGSAERTHSILVAAIEATTDERWAAPATPDAGRTVGEGVGAILGSPAGPFRHDEAHHADLEAFIEAHGGGGVLRSR